MGCVLAALGGSSRAADAAKAVVDKAIKAAGGATKLSKFKAVTWKGKGTVHAMGLDIPFTGEGTTQAPDRQRYVIQAGQGGRTAKILVVVNGDKGWIDSGGNTQELDKDKLAEAKEEMYADNVTRLAPLKEIKAYKLSSLGESKVNSHEAVGIKVSRKGHRDINLFFDKKTWLLIKAEFRVKDDTDTEVTQETIFSDYKSVQGVKLPMKLAIKRDGKPYMEAGISEYKLAEKADDNLFAKP